MVDLKATIEEINQRGEKEARQNEELLRQTAEKLKEQERQAKEKEIEKEKGEEEERKREREKKAAATVEGGSAKDSDGGGGDKGKATAVSEPTDCKLLIVNRMTVHILSLIFVPLSRGVLHCDSFMTLQLHCCSLFLPFSGYAQVDACCL